jgi:hypothetical protein
LKDRGFIKTQSRSTSSARSQGGRLCRASAGSLVSTWTGGTTRRVEGSGRALDPNGLPVPPKSINSANPAVGSDGTNYLVVWQDKTSPTFLVGTTVSGSGAVAEANGHKLITSSNTQIRPTLARGANGYLAVWSDDRETGGAALYGMLLDETGTPGSAATLIERSPWFDALNGHIFAA